LRREVRVSAAIPLTTSTCCAEPPLRARQEAADQSACATRPHSWIGLLGTQDENPATRSTNQNAARVPIA
jgi:hypothetical protein